MKNLSSLSLSAKLTFGILAVIAAYYLWTEHTAHVQTVFPTVFLLVIVLIHLKMHGGHGSHGGHK